MAYNVSVFVYFAYMHKDTFQSRSKLSAKLIT